MSQNQVAASFRGHVTVLRPRLTMHDTRLLLRRLQLPPVLIDTLMERAELARLTDEAAGVFVAAAHLYVITEIMKEASLPHRTLASFIDLVRETEHLRTRRVAS